MATTTLKKNATTSEVNEIVQQSAAISRTVFHKDVDSNTFLVEVYKTGFVKSIKFFCDKNLANDTVLCTLPEELRPHAGYFPTAIIITPSDLTQHKLYVYTNGEVVFKNLDNTGMWGTFYSTYI